MGQLDGYSPRSLTRVAENHGWRFVRQRGSHAIYAHPTIPLTISIPLHDPMPAGLLKATLRKMGISTSAFVAEARK